MPRLSVTAFRLRPLPLALALIVVTTAMPIDLRGPVTWDGTIEWLDLAVNLALYAPLGLALRRWPWHRLLLVAVLLSATIELTQVWNSDRHPSPGDVAANVGGAMLAMAIGRRRWPGGSSAGAGIPVGRRAVAGAAIVMAGLLTLGNAPARPTPVTGWDPEYPLLVGNEKTGDRPWRGTVENLALFPRTLSRGERRAAMAGDVGGFADVGAGFSLPAAVVADGGAAVRLPVEAARELARSAQAANALTIVARIRPETTLQNGPARIVSFSTDTALRNFDLGQVDRRLVFRIRTPLSGDNGARQLVESTPVLQTGTPVTVVAAYDGRVARLYVDGRLHGRNNFAAAACAVPLLADEELPAVCAVMGALLALIAVSVAGRGRRAVPAAALVAGAVTLALPLLMPGLAAAMAAMPSAAVGGLIGVAAISGAATRPEARDREPGTTAEARGAGQSGRTHS